MSVKSYKKYYDTFLSKDSFWGWGVDFNLWTVGKLKVGLLDCWPIRHFINGQGYKGKISPWIEAGNWKLNIDMYQILGSLQ